MIKKCQSYDKEYLQAAQEELAAMLDVDVYYLNYTLNDFKKNSNVLVYE